MCVADSILELQIAYKLEIPGMMRDNFSLKGMQPDNNHQVNIRIFG